MGREHSTAFLIQSAKAGDSEHFGQLLEQYRGYLLMLGHRYLADRLRRRVDPSDLVQMTFLEAQRDWEQFRGKTPGEFIAWLRHIFKNNVATAVARHLFAQKRSIDREVNAPAAARHDSAPDWITLLPADQSSPSRGVARREEVEMLFEALHRLPEAQAEAVRLRYLEGLTLEQIADRIGKSELAVAGLLKRGLGKLRSILGPRWGAAG